jgi:hypothetical protein
VCFIGWIVQLACFAGAMLLLFGSFGLRGETG